VDLDVLVRSDLLSFLVQESETRGATIVCTCPTTTHCVITVDAADATHIFDGLTVFPTHIAHLQLGGTPDDLVKWNPNQKTEQLFNLALEWIRVDRDLRREQEKARGRERGPKNDVSSMRMTVGFGRC
jgi:CCR4-NOT complex subunit CAF16